MIDIFDLRKACKKYSDIGLDISIEIDDIGLKFRGYWRDHYILKPLKYFCQMYEWPLIESSYLYLDIEKLVDIFKERFEEEMIKESQLLKGE